MYGQKLDVRQSQNAKHQDRIWAEMVGLGPGTTRRWVLGWLRCSNFNSIPLPDWDCGQTNCCQVTLELNALYRCYQKTAPRHLLCLPLLVSKYLGVTLNTNNTVLNPPPPPLSENMKKRFLLQHNKSRQQRCTQCKIASLPFRLTSCMASATNELMSPWK